MKYGYVRISTREQDEARQVEAIKSAGVDENNIIIEKASGKNFIDRKKWQELMAKVVVDDIIVIKSLDRLGRNNTEIKDTFELLSKKKVYLKFLDTPILNTEAPKNEMEKMAMEMVQPIVLHLMGFFAEQERKNIKERQREAYKLLKKDDKGRLISNKKIDKKTGQGIICGRPSKIENLTQSQKELIKSWINGNIKVEECANYSKIGRATLFKIKKMIKNKEMEL